MRSSMLSVALGAPCGSFLLTSTSGSKGEGLASLQYLPHLQVDLYPYLF